MGTKSVKKNFLYNLVYQVLILILPIATTPYISRVLGAENVGIYSFTISIVTYFTLIGSLGVSLYGQREIAYIREDKVKRKQAFLEIIIFRFITMAIAMLVYYIAYIRNSEYGMYFQILLLYLLAFAFDISWFFQGMEEFKKTVVRNVIVRIVSVGCIFIFVRTKEDLSKYLLIYSLADLIGNLSLWLYLPKYLKGYEIKNLNIKKHVMPIVALFVPQIAIKVYNIVDKTMIGYMISNKAELGNYEEAYKVINVLFTIVTSLGIVMVPRIASVFASGEKEKVNEYIIKSFRFVFFLAFPITFGIAAISKEFVPIFLGEGYENAIILINVLAPTIILNGITNVVGTQYLLPTKQQKQYTISIVIGLIVNLIANSICIIKLGALGASIATLISQTIVVAIQIYYVKNEIDVIKSLKSAINYCISSILMFIACMLTTKVVTNGVASVICKMIVGGVVYFIVLVILKDEYINEVKNIVKSRIRSKSNENKV